MKKQLTKRLLALVLAFTMVLGMAPVAFAGNGQKVKFEQVDNDVVGASLPESRKADASKEKPIYGDKDIVRVSIFLEDAATISVFSQEAADGTLAESVEAKEYRAALQMQQEAVAEYISEQVLEDEALDVVWNLTLAANAISANVEYGQIEAIKQAYGVSDVIVETRYEPMVASVEANDPNMATSSDMIGSGLAWAEGYYGKGSKIAVIDTGTDTDHQSFDADAFLYAVGDDADLMDADDIAAVLDQLNIATLVDDASKLYLNAKLPFAFNYVDLDYDITHDNDKQGEHGSHVAGIATANRYIPDGEGGYTEALSSVCTQGVAPDAQLITMKVFGKGGGAYDSDYMAAIEDAIILGADSINLSLGSGNPGFSNHSNAAYQAIMESLTESNAVVCISAGNSGTWQENTTYGFLYNDGVSMQTDGSPGSYTNSLTVASVDNTGSTGSFLNFGEGLEAVSFTETSGYTNAPIASLDTTGEGTEYDFVLFNNTGKDDNGGNLLTDYADVCAGKVVMVNRGASSFFEKHEAVSEVGGIACIVVNNQAGTINMDLSDSTATIPCVSITQADGDKLKNIAEEVIDGEGAGDFLYYTGKVIISSAIAAMQGDVDGYWTMSSFSSWGVPGSLELKPEITAPGGNIYSVNGAVAGGKAYENMSGTSMASPQMAGMVAVLAEYIRENKLTEKTGLTQRQLAQSLLMSTSEPIIEADSGNYYSILNQGSGVANVNDAINAHSYILMGEGVNAGAADGKVKVELGDDPAKTGIYSFSYTLHNLKDEPAFYSFDTDVFTQDVFSALLYSGVESLLDTWTAELENAVVSYSVNGSEHETHNDVQRVLDYVAGKITLTNEEQELYDLDGNGQITSYDAHLMLQDDANLDKVAVPANGSITVTVTIDVTDCDFTYYPTGAYIEAYSYAKEYSTDEGVEGTVHSIPVLGYYGNWTDPSMYDVGTLADYWYETEERYPYLAYATKLFTNFLTVKYPGDTGEYYYFGNPLTDDDEYLPERNAINGDTTINKFYATIIRNAGNSAVQVVDANTGEVYAREVLGSKNSAYYYSNGSAWYNTQSSVTVGWQGTDAQGNKLPEDTEVNISLILAPEYYVSEAGTDWDALGKGAYMTIRTAIDNTAPTMTDLVYDAENSTLTATASDNRYLATVALYENGVARERDFVAPNQALDAKGEADDYTLNIPVNSTGTEFYIQLTDYAMNQTTYKFAITEEGEISDEPVNPTSITLPETASVIKGTSIILTPTFEPFLAKEEVVWSSADENIATVDEKGKVTGVEAGTTTITATSAYDETVSATCEVTVKTFDVTLTGMLQDEDGNPQLFTWDLANDKTWKKTADLDHYINAATFDFAHKDGKIFQMDTEGYLYKVDVETGAVVEQSAGPADFGAPVDDMEYAGYTNLMNNKEILVGVYGSYLLYSDPAMGNTFDSGWNMASYLGPYLGASNFTAVAWAGYTFNRDGNMVDAFFCLTDTGDIWVMMPDFAAGSVGMNYYKTDLDLDFPGYDGAYYCSMVMGDDGNFYLSYFDGSTNQMYVLEGEDIYRDGEDYDTVYHATLLGDVGDAVWPAGLLAVTSNEDETAAAAERELDVKATIENVQAESFETEELVGSLNAIRVGSEVQKVDNSGATLRDRLMTVTLTEDEDATNGKYVVKYDPEAVTFTGLNSLLQHYSYYNDEENGTVTFAFANETEVPGGNVLATLKFSYGSYVNSEIEITAVERNETLPVEDDAVVIPIEDEPDGHNYDDGVVTTEPTCTEAGVKTFTCANCGGTYTEEIPANGHDWADATCTEPKTCKTCGATEGEALGHNYDDGVVTTEPTCTEAGVKTFTCANCGGTYTEEIPANGHDWADATCTEPKTCKTCGATEGEALGHNWDGGKITLKPTPTKNGERTYTCKACGESYAEVVPATGLTPVGPAPAKPVKPEQPEQPEVPEDPHAANCPSAQFADLDVNAWYHEYTDAVIGDGIMNGVGNGNFDPAANVTRSQLVTMLWRLAGSPVVNYAMSFEDVAEGTFYSEAVRWAASTGVVTGINDTTFAPDENITREQLATILFRLAQNNGLNVSNAGNTVPDFADRDQISNWAGEAMCWAYTNGIINGKGANALDPKGTASRVEAAAMMVRFQKLTPNTVQQ